MFRKSLYNLTVLYRSQSYNSLIRFPHRFISTTKMKIGTHDGVFHCDEVLACYMLKHLPEYKDAEIIRTRDMVKFNECDIVVDVGAVFDHERKRYDHHQREFNETFSSLRPELGEKFKIKLSSAGLIYTYYGHQVIKELTPKGISIKDSDLNTIYKKLYENFIQEIDAIDNGIPMYTEEPSYKIRTHISNRVARLNPDWNTKQTHNIDEIFLKAMALVGEEFLFNVNYLITVWLPARQYVSLALENRYNVHKSGHILEFTERFPWKEHMYDLEDEMNIGHEVKYVIFNDKLDSWRVQAVPVNPTSFVTRKPLNKKWWGVRDDKLSEIADIKGCIFCHANGFIGGNTTRDGALEMAVLSLEADL